jgi:hypothetical protein
MNWTGAWTPEQRSGKRASMGPGLAVYRGWMLRGEAYEALYNRLLEHDVRMLTSPAEYAACHHAPGSYGPLKKWMPQTAWVPRERIGDSRSVRDALDAFGSSPVIVKDWVKSQASGYWSEACYIVDPSDLEQVSRVVCRFLELQGDSLTGGLVFKSYVPLMPLGAPAHEYRAFIVGGRTIGCWPRSHGTGGCRRHPPICSMPSRLTSRARSLQRTLAGMSMETGGFSKWAMARYPAFRRRKPQLR